MKKEEVFKELKEEKKFYSVKIKCQNCGFERYYNDIPFNESAKAYLRDEVCSKCGCKIIIEKRKND